MQIVAAPAQSGIPANVLNDWHVDLVAAILQSGWVELPVHNCQSDEEFLENWRANVEPNTTPKQWRSAEVIIDPTWGFRT